MIKGIRKKGPKLFAILTVLALITMTLPMVAFNNAQAAQMQDVKDTISDSDVSATGVTHSFHFTTANEIPNNGDLQLVFDSNFDLSSASAQCPGGGTASVSSTDHIIHCRYNTGSLTAGTYYATATNVTNPSSEGSYSVYLRTYSSTGVLIDSGEAKVAVINSVTVTAHVPATLTFAIHGVAASTTVEAGKTNVTSTTTTIDFGTVNAGTQYIAAQKLEVQTNANDGFSVKVWQDNNLQNAMGNDIDKFKDSSTSTPQAWASPTATLGSENTYGHFGLRSDEDTNLDYAGQSVNYGTSDWVGFPGDGTANQVEVFKYNGPTNGQVQHTGWEYVEYSLEISALQEAGDYSNTLTYICTPEY